MELIRTNQTQKPTVVIGENISLRIGLFYLNSAAATNQKLLWSSVTPCFLWVQATDSFHTHVRFTFIVHPLLIRLWSNMFPNWIQETSEQDSWTKYFAKWSTLNLLIYSFLLFACSLIYWTLNVCSTTGLVPGTDERTVTHNPCWRRSQSGGEDRPIKR